jgi:predicted dehydrogenase
MSKSISRRNFIKTGAAASAVAMTAKSYAKTTGANARLNIGMIGCGGMAGSHIKSLLAMQEDENIAVTMVCDLYEKRAKGFQAQVEGADGNAVVTQDYTDILSNPDIDYVVIATPEHSHHYLTIAALEAGKHVYCEKPMCYDIKEAKDVVAKVKETGLKMQVGVQGTADDSYSSAYQAIRDGKLGTIVEAQIDYVRNHPLDRGPWRNKNTKSDMPKPEDLDWDNWVTPRSERPWHPHHYFEWRCYRDYSGGISTDLFVHRITRLIKACGLTFPSRVAGMGGIYTWDDGRDLPDSMEVLLEYPKTEGVTDGMTVHLLGTMANQRQNQHCIRGQEATLVFNRKGWEIISQEDNKVIETHKKTGGEDVTPHHKNHHNAIRHGEALNCPPELGLYGVVAARMGNLSVFQKKMVAWDFDHQHVIHS